MGLKNKAVFYSLLLFCTLMRSASLADLRRTRREDSKKEHYTCSDLGKHYPNHPKGAPSITPSCNSVDYEVDDDVYITCEVKSNPIAKITWLFNGKPPKHKLDMTSCSQKLHISHAGIEDSGEYTCMASNEYGSVNHTCHLTIYAPERKFFIINKGILFNGDRKSTKAAIGSPLNMTCEVYNAHHVYWTKNGFNFPSSTPPNLRISTHKKKMGKTMFKLHLMFTTVEEEDRGNYSCAARDTLLGYTVRSYKYLEPVFAALPAGRQASSSPSMSAIPSAVFLILTLCYTHAVHYFDLINHFNGF